MHSRIFQIETSPVDKDNYIGESRYYDSFVGQNGVDYVDEGTDRDDDIEWLRKSLEGIATFEDDHFIITNKKAYFEDKYDKFKKLIDNLGTMSIEDFMGNAKEGTHYDQTIDYQMFLLEAAYDSKYEFYVDSIDYNMKTMDEFMRKADENVPYYIGATIDYHF